MISKREEKEKKKQKKNNNNGRIRLIVAIKVLLKSIRLFVETTLFSFSFTKAIRTYIIYAFYKILYYESSVLIRLVISLENLFFTYSHVESIQYPYSKYKLYLV